MCTMNIFLYVCHKILTVWKKVKSHRHAHIFYNVSEYIQMCGKCLKESVEM